MHQTLRTKSWSHIAKVTFGNDFIFYATNYFPSDVPMANLSCRQNELWGNQTALIVLCSLPKDMYRSTFLINQDVLTQNKEVD